ncbi:MAG: hypothetical protein EA425_14595 [Puniceicoccaceae bacterium]|nr:MAG: hypothetical protein EA425_14595 [Puniceicoccaceae bacterium]
MNESFLDIVLILLDGGWVMVPLFLLGLVIFGLGARLLIFFFSGNYRKTSDDQAEVWIKHPDKAQGQVGEMIRYSQDGIEQMDDIRSRFEEIRLTEVPRLNHSITVLNILVNAAPLLGLLGTVLGMLTTFHGIALGGAEKTDALVAQGISEALITTQMGLFLAIPGYFLVYSIKQQRLQYESFLVRLESLTLQHFQKIFKSEAA